MIDVNIDLKGYGKKFSSIFENITDECLTLTKSNSERDIALGEEISLELAEAVGNIVKVKNRNELLMSYMKAEKCVNYVLRKMGRETIRTKKKTAEDDFITESPDI